MLDSLALQEAIFMRLFRQATVLITMAALGALAQAPALNPKETVERFARLDAEGTRLTANGWRETDGLFVETSERRKPKTLFVIAGNYAVSEAPERSAPPKFLVGYEELGYIDNSSLAFTPTNGGPTRRFDSYTVVQLEVTSKQWKIKGSQPTTVHLTARAAIAYVRRKRSETSDPETQSNADQTLSRLRLYR